MAKNVNHIQHIKSSVVVEENGVLSPKLPTPSAIVEGEIAVNFAEGYETLSIKNNSGDIVTFSCDDKFYDKTFIDNKLGSGFTSENSATTVTQMIEENELVTSSALNDLNANKADISAVTDVQDDISELSAITTAHTENTTIHLTSSEKSNLHSHSNKSALDSITGSVGTMAYESANNYTDTATTSALNDVVTAHTANTTIHLTSTEKEQLHTHTNKSALDSITGSVGTMAYENVSLLDVYADSVLYNSTSHKVEFYHGTTGGTKVFEFDASAFIIDGMVDNVEIDDVTSGSSTVKCLVVSFNTDAGKQDINIPLSDIFDPDEYYTKSETSGASEIENALDEKANLDELGETIHYLTSMTGTAGGTNLSASWSGNSSEITELYTGLCVRFLIPTAGHATGVTLSINGGEKHKVLYNNTTLTTHYGVNSILDLTYDANTTGTYYSGSSTQASVQGVWRANADYYTDAIGYYIGHNQKVYKTDASLYRYKLLLQKDETTLTPVNTSNTSAGTKTLTTESFNPFGDIIYYSSTSSAATDSMLAANTTWTQYGINLSYSFNTTDTLVSGISVYMVAVPQSDGRAKLHSSPITQTLPTTDDGLIYIYLGQAYSATNIFLMNNHPIYHYKDGQLRLYTNGAASVVVDQVIDSGTSASTNAVATQAVYNTLKDTELVWTNAYVTLSGVVSSHTENSSIHLTASDRTKLDSITGVVGTMAYENTSVLNGYADSVKYNSTSHEVEFYHGTTAGTMVFSFDASPFIIDGMVDNVEIDDVTSGSSTVKCLVVSFNTDAGKQDINIPLSDIFDPDEYYTKQEADTALSGKVDTTEYSTFSADTNDSIDDLSGQCMTIAYALNDLNERKLDASAYTPTDLSNYYTKSETSGASEIEEALSGKVNFSDVVSAITAENSGSTNPVSVRVVSENELITSIALNDLAENKLDVTAYTPTDLSDYYTKEEIGEFLGSGVTTANNVTNIIEENEYAISTALNDLAENKLDVTAYTPTDLSNYYTKSETSGATEISTALTAKADEDKLGETIHYLTSMTGAAGDTNLSASWSGNSSEITELYTGLCVRFLIPTAGHATGVTLSINGGEKHKVLYNSGTTLTTQYGVNTILNLTYDANATGTYYSGSSTAATVQGVWRANAEYDSNTNTIGYEIGHNQKVYKTDASLYKYKLLLQKDETTLTPVNTTNTSAGTKTLTTESFNPFGDIIYYSSTSTVSANTVIASGLTWTQHSVNLAYSFNTTDTLTSGRSVYMVAVPQSDGKAKLHSSPITQTFPTTEDGLIYIYLGQAYSTTNIFLMNNHPIYYYKDGQLRLYTNSVVSSHPSSYVTSMDGYSKPSTTSAISTSDTLNGAIGKLECALGGIKLVQITQTDYDNLGTKDPNTLYIITT